MRYNLTDGTTMSPAELVLLVDNMTIANARCRLTRTKVREKLLEPVRFIKLTKAHTIYELTNGKEYTINELMNITGCGYATVLSRLHASAVRDAERIMKPGRPSNVTIDKTIATKHASERMIGDPDGFWKLFNRLV